MGTRARAAKIKPEATALGSAAMDGRLAVCLARGARPRGLGARHQDCAARRAFASARARRLFHLVRALVARAVAIDEVPRIAPDIVVEILSPDDRRIDLGDKLDVYLQAGTTLALVVNPRTRIVETFSGPDLVHARQATYCGEDITTCEPFEGLTLALRDLFAAIDS